MLSQKLLVDVSVDMFVGENRYWRHKSNAQSACIASFCPLATMLGSGRHLGAFYLKNEAPTFAGALADLHETSVLRKAFSDELAASDITL
jgi:hypothetical protein